MDKETYKVGGHRLVTSPASAIHAYLMFFTLVQVAVNLLERFGDKKQLRLSNTNNQALNRTTVEQQRTPQAAARLSTTIAGQQPSQRSVTPYSSVYRNNNNNNNNTLNSSIASTQSMTLTSASPQMRAVQELRRRSPFPIVDERSRSAIDRIVDFIVGDTPQNRFGMICKACHAHNGNRATLKLRSPLRIAKPNSHSTGMLHKEEYEYTTFRCAFCNVLNPARKKRPVAPRLSLEAPTPASTKRNDSSESESSDDDSGVYFR